MIVHFCPYWLRRTMESIQTDPYHLDYTLTTTFFRVSLFCLTINELNTICSKVEHDSLLVFLSVKRISSFLQQHVNNFETKILVLMKACMKHYSLHIFIWEVYYLLGIGQCEYLLNSWHVSLY